MLIMNSYLLLMEIISENIIEASEPWKITYAYIDLIFQTEEFLAYLSEKDGVEYSYETKVWFGTPSIIRLIIYK